MAEQAKLDRRTPRGGDSRPVVAVVGAARGPGALLAQRLAAGKDYRSVVAIDAARPKGAKGAKEGPDRLTWRTARIDHPDVAQTLSGVDVVVRLPGWAPPFAPHVDGRSAGAAARALLTAAAAEGVGRAVVVTSAVDFAAHRGVGSTGARPCSAPRSPFAARAAAGWVDGRVDGRADPMGGPA